MGESELRRRTMRPIGDERGIALVMTLLVMATLTIASGALIALTTSNEHAFSRDRQEARAFNVAEAGLNYGISQLTNYDGSGAVAVNSTIGSSAVPVSYALDGGGGWWAKKTAPGTWTVWSQGKSPNGQVSRTVSVQALGNTTSTNVPPSLAWGYGFYVASPTGCTNMVGTAALSLPVWINASLCLTGSQQILEPAAAGPKRVTLYVGGRLEMGNNNEVGTPTRPIISATVVGGCKKQSSFPICSNSAVSEVYADSYSSTPSTLTKPPVYPQEVYDSGDWDNPVCTTGSFVFDNDGTRNGSRGAGTIINGPSFNCTVNDPSGTTQVGTLVWNSTTRVLTVDGIIFIDGGLTLNGGDQASYEGFATIYFNGPVQTNGGSALCGPGATLTGSSCSGLWDGDLGALAIVALSGGWTMNGNAEYNVAAYVVGLYDTGGDAYVTGPVITDTAKVYGTTDHTELADPPPGAPGGGGTTVSTDWTTIKGTWSQLGS